MKISYAEYQRIAVAILEKLDQLQARSDDGSVRRSALIEWYLKQIEDDIDSVEQLEMETKKVKSVIGRLIKAELKIVKLREVGGLLEDGEAGEGVEEDPLLQIAPNVSWDD
ncbi:MCM DNA helicase complex subunit mcm6 [Nowakowskiella sp. JEL0407]|nr:MCM DNA helicase complex subunit mcm6 [Nowakowskiella sp. JEL0407]